jgi:propionyl-CoA synthetase
MPRAPPFYAWFSGGELNACHNALDRHADGGRGEPAGADLRFAGHGARKTFTYRELRDRVAELPAQSRPHGRRQG